MTLLKGILASKILIHSFWKIACKTYWNKIMIVTVLKSNRVYNSCRSRVGIIFPIQIPQWTKKNKINEDLNISFSFTKKSIFFMFFYFYLNHFWKLRNACEFELYQIKQYSLHFKVLWKFWKGLDLGIRIKESESIARKKGKVSKN